MANKCRRSVAVSRVWQYLLLCTIALNPGVVTIGQAQRVATGTTNRTPETQRVTVNVDNAPLLAVLRSIARQAGLVPAFNESIMPVATRVTLHVREVAVPEAFQQALRGTGLVASVQAGGDVIVVRDGNLTAVAGTIIGKVTDSKTRLPLRGAKLGLDGTDRAVETADDGTYRFAGVNGGAHTVTIKLLGYTKVVRTVSVQDNSVTTVDVALESSATPLDQIVVTGTIIPTELKAVPNAITVVTAKQIEDRGITKIDQLFRGDVPGLFAQNLGSSALLDEVTMFSRGATAINNTSSGTSQGTNPIKTYVDGVELADPKYLSQIDPKSIERIEILTGPQASTIYGSNAINGVMQIFTKRGASNTPQVTLNLLSGWVENNFSSAHTPQHDYSVQLSGVEGRLSYNAGGSWNYMGPWTPAKQFARTGGFGGARLDLPTPAGRVTADMTLRRSITQTLTRGSSSQAQVKYLETGWWNGFYNNGVSTPTTSTLTGQTLGVTLSYAPTSWWSHEFGVGTDVSDAETRYTAPGYRDISDTTLSLTQNHTDRRSLRYATTARVPFSSFAQATVTAGADAWQNVTSSVSVSPPTLTGYLDGTSSITRQPGHNTGGFLQTQLGLKDRLFFTYGLRAEWNPGYGQEAQPNFAPRYGVVYTQELETPLGPLTAKLRGSYGRSTRPPMTQLQRSDPLYAGAAQYYGPVMYQLANPDLGPEYQKGGEGGIELYLGNRGTVTVTRYNQTVDQLIDLIIGIDSVDLLPAVKQQYGLRDWQSPLRQTQFFNVGSLRNQGWELQGSMNVGPITTRGTYSWTKSRVIGVTPKFRALFAGRQDWQPGATFEYLPEHTWAFGVTYAKASSSVALNLTGTGWAMIYNDDRYLRSLSSNIRLMQNRLNVSNVGRYINFNAPYALADLTASHRFHARVEGVLQVQNLADRYTNDYYAASATMGRQTKIGLRLR